MSLFINFKLSKRLSDFCSANFIKMDHAEHDKVVRIRKSKWEDFYNRFSEGDQQEETSDASDENDQECERTAANRPSHSTLSFCEYLRILQKAFLVFATNDRVVKTTIEYNFELPVAIWHDRINSNLNIEDDPKDLVKVIIKARDKLLEKVHPNLVLKIVEHSFKTLHVIMDHIIDCYNNKNLHLITIMNNLETALDEGTFKF